MESVRTRSSISMDIYKYENKWYKITPKPYEPERQTAKIAWAQIREPTVTKEEHYRKYYENLRKEAQILYPSFRKDAS